MRTVVQCAALLGVALLATGCATGNRSVNSAIQLSFEQLGSDAASRSGDYNYRTAVNITGVSLPYSVGSMVSNPGGSLPELLALPQSYGCSKIVETVYPYRNGNPTQGAADVAGISAQIDAASAALAAQAAARLRLTILAGAVRRAEEIRSGEADAAKATTAIDADPVITGARRSLSMSMAAEAFSTDNIKAKRDQLEAQLATAQDAQSAATAALRELRSHPNLMVFRWTAEESRRAGLQLGSILGLRSERGQSRTGYVVLADVRTAALSPGADMVWATELARQHPDWIERTFGDRYVTTFTLAARHVAFAEDRNWSALLNANLSLSPAQLSLLVGGDVQELITSQSLQLEAALATIISSSSQGSISAPQRTFYNFRMTSSEARQYSSYLESQRNNGYSIIYSTRTTIEEAANGDSSRRPSRDFLSSERVHRCIHSVLSGPFAPIFVQSVGGGTVTASADADSSARPNIRNRSSFAAVDAEGRPIEPAQVRGHAPAEPAPLIEGGPILFCLPRYSEYHDDPFRSVNPDPRLKSTSLEDEQGNSLTQRCVDLAQPYAPDDPNAYTSRPYR